MINHYSFAELSMNGIKLSSQVVDSLSALVKTPSLSKLLVGSSGIGTVKDVLNL